MRCMAAVYGAGNSVILLPMNVSSRIAP
jgi:hypothetical protein